MTQLVTKYWIVASSGNNPLHRYDGEVVIGPTVLKKSEYVYLIDSERYLVFFEIETRYLEKWHPKDENHKYCYCKRSKKNDNQD